jgi:hypothetical protein
VMHSLEQSGCAGMPTPGTLRRNSSEVQQPTVVAVPLVLLLWLMVGALAIRDDHRLPSFQRRIEKAPTPGRGGGCLFLIAGSLKKGRLDAGKRRRLEGHAQIPPRVRKCGVTRHRAGSADGATSI